LGSIIDLFWELVSFPCLLINPNFSLEVLLIREEELRRYDGKRNWRRRGWITEERRLLEVINRRLFEEPVDLQALLPVKAEDMFTISDLAQAVGIGRRLSQRMAYCLFKARVIELIGKRGRANLYGIVAPNDAWNET
jgi:hypothetical protein